MKYGLTVLLTIIFSLSLYAEDKADRKLKRDKQVYCSCEQMAQRYQKVIDNENKAAKYSGVVNKQKMYNAGKLVQVSRDIQEKIAKRSPAAATCDKLPEVIACMEEITNQLGN